MHVVKEDASDDRVVASAASVAASAALRAMMFQQRIFTIDSRLAFEDKTKVLDRTQAQHLASQVEQYRGTKLWMFVMKQVKQIDPSPRMLHAGFEQNMEEALKTTAAG